jgi:uncharacterized protein YggE
MKTITFSVFLILAMATSAMSQRGEPQPPSALVVNGNAQVLAVPDQATVRLGIVRQATTAQAAQEQVNAVAKEILNAIGRVGINAKEIQTARLVLTPVYAPRSPESRDAPRIVAYNASNTVAVRVENLSLVGPVIDAGLKAGANQLDGVQFGLRNDLPAREQALKEAVAEARSKAQVMAAALNVGLIEVLEVTEGGVSLYPVAESAQFAGRTMALAADTPVSPGQLEVRANVTIRYRIAPKPQ